MANRARHRMLSPGFIGIPVPAGRHTVVFRYAPGNWKLWMALAGLLAVLLIRLTGRRCLPIDSTIHLPYDVGHMAKPDSLGQFEQLVMTAILARREDAYGVTIHSKVEELARPKAVSLGAVYVTLDRLEDKGLIASWLSDPTAERGGRAKRCYRLEALGERVLEESAVTARRIWESLVDVWGREWGRRWGRELR